MMLKQKIIVISLENINVLHIEIVKSFISYYATNRKFNLIPNGLEKYMSFSIKNKLSFIDGFQFLTSSLDSLVKILRNDYFK